MLATSLGVSKSLVGFHKILGLQNFATREVKGQFSTRFWGLKKKWFSHAVGQAKRQVFRKTWGLKSNINGCHMPAETMLAGYGIDVPRECCGKVGERLHTGGGEAAVRLSLWKVADRCGGKAVERLRNGWGRLQLWKGRMWECERYHSVVCSGFTTHEP